MGKYTEVMGDMEKLPPADMSYQSRVDQKKGEITLQPVTTVELVGMYRAAKLQVEEVKAQEKEINLLLAALTQLIVAAYDDEGLKSIKLENGATVTTQPEPYAVVEDKAAMLAWALDDPDLKQALTLPWQSLNALVKERLLNGQELPPGVKAYVKESLVLRGAKGKA